MNFNKIFSSVMKRENSINILNLGYVTLIISLVSLIGLFLYSFKDSIITCYYFIKNRQQEYPPGLGLICAYSYY